MKPNQQLRETAKKEGVFLWEIAEEIGFSEGYFSRLLRHDLTETLHLSCQKAIKAINERKKKGSNDGPD